MANRSSDTQVSLFIIGIWNFTFISNPEHDSITAVLEAEINTPIFLKYSHTSIISGFSPKVYSKVPRKMEVRLHLDRIIGVLHL